jgi:hypothetical protein
MRLKQKLTENITEEKKLTNTDKILLKSAARGLMPKIEAAIDNYFSQTDDGLSQLLSGNSKMTQKKKIAFRVILDNLKRMESSIV